MEIKGVGCVQYTNPETKKDEYVITLDIAYMPKDWTLDKWIEYLKKDKIAIIDSFNKGIR